MALNATSLATLIISKFETKFGEIHPQGVPGMELMAAALAEAIVEHIATNAEVVISTSTSGLQRDPDLGTDTLAPSTQKVLTVT